MHGEKVLFVTEFADQRQFMFDAFAYGWRRALRVAPDKACVDLATQM